jgi:hypothetical protein
MVAALPLHQQTPDITFERKPKVDTGDDIAIQAIQAVLTYHKYFKKVQRQMRVLMAADALDTESIQHKFETEVKHTGVTLYALEQILKQLEQEMEQVWDEYITYMYD